MRHIDKEQIEAMIPADWEAKAVTARTAVADATAVNRAKTIEKHDGVWSCLKPILSKFSEKKCWYCESAEERSDKAVDHYRPNGRVAEDHSHGGYWWLAFKWENFRFSCTFCNERRVDKENGTAGGKIDHFPLWKTGTRACCETDDHEAELPLLLDPFCETDPQLLWFNEDGSPSPNPTLCNESDYLTERVSKSITFYHLDHQDLVEKRAKLCKDIRDDVKLGDRMLLRMKKGNSDEASAAKETLDHTLKKLRKHLRLKSELSSTAWCMLEGMRQTSPTAVAVLRLAYER